jgi:uncharacterized protein YjgD (DUF1641 family)
MAQQLQYTPPCLDPKPEFRNRIHDVTEQRAEALIATYQLLEVARSNEAIDILQGAIGAKTTIFEQIADFGSKPSSVTAVSNLIALARFLGEIDTGVLSRFAEELKTPRPTQVDSPPSIWQLTKEVDHPDVRRGLYFILQTVEALGRAVKS